MCVATMDGGEWGGGGGGGGGVGEACCVLLLFIGSSLVSSLAFTCALASLDKQLTVMPQHAAIADKFLADLARAAKTAREDQSLAKQSTAAIYGSINVMADVNEAAVEDFVTSIFSEIYKV